MIRASLASPAMVLVASCASYSPAPVAPASYTAELDARRLPPLDAGRAWTTADLLRTSLDWSPPIRQALANYRSLAAAARAARVPLPANLTLTAEYSHRDNPAKPWLGSGLFDIPLDIGGRRDARVTNADLAVLQARYDYAEAIWSVRSAIRHAIIDSLALSREKTLADQSVAMREDRVRRLAARVRAGEDARPTAVVAQSDLVAAEQRAQALTAQLVQANGALARAIGVAPVATGLVPLATLPDIVDRPPDIPEWRANAAAGRNDVLRAIIDYDLAESALRLEVARQYPDIRISPGYTYERGIVKLPFGVALGLPPIDLNRAAIAAAEAQRAQAGKKLEALQATVLADMDRAAAALTAAEISETRARTRDLVAAVHLADAASRGVAAGEIDHVDALAAAAAAVDARIAAIEAWRVAWSALADLEDAARRPTDPADAQILAIAMQRLETQP